MVTQVGSQIFGIVVDGVFHTEEIVVKPMSSKLRHIAVFSGTTILGDGSVIMIIDPNGIAQIARPHGADRARRRAGAPTAARTAAETIASLLVFRAGSHAAQGGAAVAGHPARRDRLPQDRNFQRPPSGAISRPADAALRSMTQSGVKQDGAQPILVFSDRGRSMGLVVDEIIDIVEERLDIEVASERPGVLGYAVVKGNATEIIDIGHFLPQAFADWFRRARCQRLRVDAAPCCWSTTRRSSATC